DLRRAGSRNRPRKKPMSSPTDSPMGPSTTCETATRCSIGPGSQFTPLGTGYKVPRIHRVLLPLCNSQMAGVARLPTTTMGAKTTGGCAGSVFTGVAAKTLAQTAPIARLTQTPRMHDLSSDDAAWRTDRTAGVWFRVLDCHMASTSPGPALLHYAQEELDAAIEALDAFGGRLHPGVHRARKAMRRTRATLAMARTTLGPGARIVDRAMRCANRSLSLLRDAHALVETLDRLIEKAQDEAMLSTLQRARHAAAGRRRALAEDAQ